MSVFYYISKDCGVYGILYMHSPGCTSLPEANNRVFWKLYVAPRRTEDRQAKGGQCAALPEMPLLLT